MFRKQLYAVLSLSLVTVLPGPAAGQSADSAAFIVRLGQDTTAVERYVRSGDRIEATSVSRSPRTTVTRLTIWLGPDGRVARYAVGGDSGAMTERTPQDGAIPIVGGFYVPWELALRQAAASGAAESVVQITTGSGTMPIEMRRTASGSWVFGDQFDQASEAVLDARGRMQSYAIDDGRISVERVAWVDLDALATAFAARDQAGAAMGSLSPLDNVRLDAGGTVIAVEYSRPSLRGRSLDMLVPPGEVWRTGANNATTFTIDRPVSFGDLRLAPGSYSIFTLREDSGWTLIFNSQTGMSGLARDPARDIGRVPMQVRRLDQPVETFTIALEAADGGGVIRLRWGGVEASAAFRTN